MTSSLEGGGSGYPPKVMTSFSHDMMTRGRGGVWIPRKSDDVIYEQPLIAVSGSGVYTYHYTDDLLRLHCLHWLHWPLLTGSIIYTGAPLMGPNAPLPWALVHMSRPLGSLHHLVIPTMLFMLTVHKSSALHCIYARANQSQTV